MPDMYQKSIYTINYKKLKKKGIKCLLFDLNNTLVSYNEDYPTDKLRELIFDLEKDFKIFEATTNVEKQAPVIKDLPEYFL